MGNLERPLTWILIIGLLGYLFVANCTCGEEIPPLDPVTDGETRIIMEQIESVGLLDGILVSDTIEVDTTTAEYRELFGDEDINEDEDGE